MIAALGGQDLAWVERNNSTCLPRVDYIFRSEGRLPGRHKNSCMILVLNPVAVKNRFIGTGEVNVGGKNKTNRRNSPLLSPVCPF